MLASGTEIYDLKTRTSSILGSLQEVAARAAETKRNLKKALETIAVSGFCEKTLKQKFSSLTQEYRLYVWSFPTFVLI